MSPETLQDALHAAKQSWFKLAMEEKYPHTKETTEKLDKLERTIKELKATKPS